MLSNALKITGLCRPGKLNKRGKCNPISIYQSGNNYGMHLKDVNTFLKKSFPPENMTEAVVEEVCCKKQFD